MTFLVILLGRQIGFHNFRALIIYSLKLITFLFCSSLLQFRHFSVKMLTSSLAISERPRCMVG